MKKSPKLDNEKNTKNANILSVAHIAQLVEHVHGKDGVVSSILAVGTTSKFNYINLSAPPEASITEPVTKPLHSEHKKQAI